MVTKTVVNYPDDNKKLGSTIARKINRLIPLEPFSALSPNKKMWHDKLSNTSVIKNKPY